MTATKGFTAPGGAPLYPLPDEAATPGVGVEAFARLVRFCTVDLRRRRKIGRPRTVLTDEMQRARLTYGRL